MIDMAKRKPKESQRVAKNVVAPEDWIEAFTEAARVEGLSLSDWADQCCISNLPKAVAEALQPHAGFANNKPASRSGKDTNSSRFNLSAPPDHWEAFTAAAKKTGVSRSAWVRDCCAASLTLSAIRKLSEPKAAHRPRG